MACLKNSLLRQWTAELVTEIVPRLFVCPIAIIVIKNEYVFVVAHLEVTLDSSRYAFMLPVLTRPFKPDSSVHQANSFVGRPSFMLMSACLFSFVCSI